jgi:hypothetical protein
MVKLDPQLVDELTDSAADAQESMDQTVNRLLRLAIQVESKAPDGQRQHEAPQEEPDKTLESDLAPPIRWHVVRAGAPSPGFDPANRSYLDLLADES